MKVVVFLSLLATLNIGCQNSNPPSETKIHAVHNQYFYHNLLIKWKDSIDTEMKAEMLDLLKGIPEKIEGFETIEFKTLEKGEKEFDLLVIQKYSSREAEEIYQTHPDHLKAKTYGVELIAKMAKFDYWGE